jgi:hypothetical protein
MRAGKLPLRRPDRTWGGPGVGVSCAICSEAIKRHQLESELQTRPAGRGAPGDLPPPRSSPLERNNTGPRTTNRRLRRSADRNRREACGAIVHRATLRQRRPRHPALLEQLPPGFLFLLGLARLAAQYAERLTILKPDDGRFLECVVQGAVCRPDIEIPPVSPSGLCGLTLSPRTWLA